MTSKRQPGSEGQPPELSSRQSVPQIYFLPHIRRSRYLGFSASRKEARDWFQCRTARKSTRDATPIHQPAVGHASDGTAPIQTEDAAETSGVDSPQTEQGKLEWQTAKRASLDGDDVRLDWPVLRNLLRPAPASGRASVSANSELRQPPAVLLFSFAGGVGKSTVTATLARALAARRERVLAVDASSRGLLPFAFGTKELKQGVVRTFGPPSGEPCIPVQTITLDPARQHRTDRWAEPLLELLRGQAAQADRILIDVPTANEAMAASLLSFESPIPAPLIPAPLIPVPLILVPLLPDVHSAADVQSIETFFSRLIGEKRAVGPFYLLNQFDPVQPRHNFVKEALRATVGDRLLQSTIRWDTAVSDALAEGMTILDYKPESQAAEDYRKLADWLATISLPSSALSSRRWTER